MTSENKLTLSVKQEKLPKEDIQKVVAEQIKQDKQDKQKEFERLCDNAIDRVSDLMERYR
tara:strand:+ start:1496 stop:1675 length:180 start_codon:yes stop_codon:yes gene_type:complete